MSCFFSFVSCSLWIILSLMFHVTWLGMITHEVIVWLLLPHVPACDHWVHDDWPMGATVGQSRCCRWQKLNYIAPWGSDVWVFLGTPNYSTKKITIHQVYTCIHILVGKTYYNSRPNSLGKLSPPTSPARWVSPETPPRLLIQLHTHIPFSNSAPMTRGIC